MRIALLASVAAAVVRAAGASADTGPSPGSNVSAPDVPAWVFPLNPPPAQPLPPLDDVKPIRLPNSAVTFTEAQLNNLFAAPDWHPDSHTPMPPVVAQGRAPDVFACGFCHTPSGQGRPENASLAGLPAAYIVQQVADFQSGARHGAWPGYYRPSALMTQVAQHATEDEVAAAAQYFSLQRLRPRVRVIERARVPKSHVVGWVYAADEGGGQEPLGERLLEFASDPQLHESRADDSVYVAYVPPGSIRRGHALAQGGAGSADSACSVCHGSNLRGVGLIPPLSGRSPTYVLRQLLAFKTGARSGPMDEPMRKVVAHLRLDNMIDAAAYAASLPP